jgi:phytoene desaturase
MDNKKIVTIGAGFSGLSAACFLAKGGYDVTVLEKHDVPGGRARKLEENGFSFDMGPSWYWMPDVFERFFEKFGQKVSDYYELVRLNPSYRIYWEDGFTDIPDEYEELKSLFESLEPNSGKKLDKFNAEAAYKYRVGMQKLVYKPGQSISELADMDVIKGAFKLDLLSSVKKHIGSHFTNPKIRQILEFPVLFLGALPENTPALYSLMNYAAIQLGTWYPRGGMIKIIEGMFQLADSLGVKFHFNQNVKEIKIKNACAKEVLTDNTSFPADIVLGSADYHFIEQYLLPEKYRSYSDKFWNSRLMAPSCLLYFVGLNKRLIHLQHHSLFFDVPFDLHAREIYITHSWPEEPLFYVSCTSKTDYKVAPYGCENLFILIPVSSGLMNDTEDLREKYFEIVIRRMEKITGENIMEAVIYKKMYGPSDFKSDYNAFKGNAYGLANTLMQTAHLKPSMKSKKVRNLFYTGQLTVPGPGVPPGIISGEVVARLISKTKQSKIANNSNKV